MGMTIDEAISWLVSITEHEGEDIPIYDDDVKAISVAIDTMRKYQIFQDQSLSLYMERLRADMVAMLTEIQSEIEELPMYYDPLDISDLIKQKINALKENTDET